MALQATVRREVRQADPQVIAQIPARRDAAGRTFIVVLSIVTLSAILGLVEAMIPRMVLGALVMGFLTWSAYTSASRPRGMAGPPPGVRERRRNHTLRRRIDEFLRSVRRMDGIARDTREGFVRKETADRALLEIERTLNDLTRQIRVLAGRST
jgi:hypothetical protein